jgi:hypothetical protein
MKNIILLTITMFIFSCIEQKSKQHYIAEGIKAAKIMHQIPNPNVITINQEKYETVPYTELQHVLKDVKYIPLISKEPIGEIKKLLICKDRIFVLDAFKAEKVFIFNMQGEIIKIIDSKGGGPEEYAGLLDMNISIDEDCIALNDRLRPFTLYFSLDGKFIRKERKISSWGFAIMGNIIINQLAIGQSYEDNLNYHLVATTKGDSILRRGFPFYPVQIEAITTNSLFYNTIGELLFVPNMSDTVYQILSDSTYMVKYIIKHKKSIWEKYDQHSDNKQYFDLITKSDYTRLNVPILETERFVYTPIQAKKEIEHRYLRGSYDYWYDKTKDIVFALGKNTRENFSFIYYVIPSPRAVYGNYYAGLIDNVAIEAHKQNLAQPVFDTLIYKNEELKAMLKSTNPNLEAILVLYEFK